MKYILLLSILFGFLSLKSQVFQYPEHKIAEPSNWDSITQYSALEMTPYKNVVEIRTVNDTVFVYRFWKRYSKICFQHRDCDYGDAHMDRMKYVTNSGNTGFLGSDEGCLIENDHYSTHDLMLFKDWEWHFGKECKK